MAALSTVKDKFDNQGSSHLISNIVVEMLVVSANI